MRFAFGASLAALALAGPQPAGLPPWACGLAERPSLAAGSLSKAVVELHAKPSAQKVPAVDADSLADTVQGAPKGVLVVFYAKWCKHCKDFVLQGSDGDPAKAPIELLHNQLVLAKGPQVVKFDVDAGKIPEGYDVQYVPSIFFADKSGARSVFSGDPASLQYLKDFALRGGFESNATALVSHAAAPAANGSKPVAAVAAAPAKASLLQTGRRLRPWAAIGDDIDRLTGRPTLAQRHAREAKAEASALQEEQEVAGGGAIGQAIREDSAASRTSLGRLSEELDEHLERTPTDAIAAWISEGPKMPPQPSASLIQSAVRKPSSQKSAYLRDLE